jgi:hypothetical protein
MLVHVCCRTDPGRLSSIFTWLFHDAQCVDCRTKLGQSTFRRAAGNAAIGCAGVEDVNLSSLIQKHADWCRKMDQIVSILNLD